MPSTSPRALKLYVADPASVPRIGASPPSWMCEALLRAKGLAFRRVALSFEKGEHRSAAMLEKNPRGSIPVLEHGEAIVHETFAVMLYAESLAQGHLPADVGARAAALTVFLETDYLKSAGMKALGSFMRTGDLGDTTDLDAELGRWNAIVKRGFACSLAGDDGITLADFVLFAYVETLARVGHSLARWPHLEAYLARPALRRLFVEGER